MYDFFKRRQDIIIFVVLFIVSISLLMASLRGKKSLSFIENAALFTFAPFQNALDYSSNKASIIWNDYLSLVDARIENESLKKDIEKLEYENSALLEQLANYKRLDTLLTFPNLTDVSFEAVRIIGKDTASKVKVITINKGSKRGIKVDMPVVTHKGLVGRVASVSTSSAKVLLISDVRSAIDAIVQETRDGLVVVGVNTPKLETRYLAVKANVKNGQRVISSGMGGAFPKGLLIGFLEDVKETENRLFMDAKLRPAVDLARLEEALVLKDTTTLQHPPEDTLEK